MAPRKPIDVVSFTLRLREELRAKLEAEAAKNGVSLNQEIITRLADTFETDLGDRLDAVEKTILETRRDWDVLQRRFDEFQAQTELASKLALVGVAGKKEPQK